MSLTIRVCWAGQGRGAPGSEGAAPNTTSVARMTPAASRAVMPKLPVPGPKSRMTPFVSAAHCGGHAEASTLSGPRWCAPSVACSSASNPRCTMRGGGGVTTPGALTAAAASSSSYCDQKVANREIRVWHFVVENGY